MKLFADPATVPTQAFIGRASVVEQAFEAPPPYALQPWETDLPPRPGLAKCQGAAVVEDDARVGR